MSGFEATGDPLLAKGWRVTKAYILDPLYPYGDDVWGPSPKPGTAISVAAVGRQFVRAGEPRATPGTCCRARQRCATSGCWSCRRAGSGEGIE